MGDDHILRPATYAPFNSAYFGEGITLFNETHYLALTWKEHTFLVIDRNTFKVVQERPYPKGYKEGWGLTHSSTEIFASDGSNTIYKLDPSSLEIKKRLSVTTEKGTPVYRLNELEYYYDTLSK